MAARKPRRPTFTAREATILRVFVGEVLAAEWSDVVEGTSVEDATEAEVEIIKAKLKALVARG